MPLYDEIKAAIAMAEANEFPESRASIDDIMRVHSRVPFDDTELKVALSAVSVWNDEGHNVFMGRLSFRDEYSTSRAALGAVLRDSDRGVCCIRVEEPLFLEMAVIKVHEGTGFLGRKKIGYQVYLNPGDGMFASVGRAGSMLLAVTKLSAVLRLPSSRARAR